MLKDLMHAIFKEDVEEDMEEVEDEQGNEEEAAHEQVHFEETVSRPAAEPVSEIPQPVFTMPTPTPVSQPATGENAVDESIFEGLDVDTISSKPKRKNESYHFDRSKLNRKRKTSRLFRRFLAIWKIRKKNSTKFMTRCSFQNRKRIRR